MLLIPLVDGYFAVPLVDGYFKKIVSSQNKHKQTIGNAELGEAILEKLAAAGDIMRCVNWPGLSTARCVFFSLRCL